MAGEPVADLVRFPLAYALYLLNAPPPGTAHTEATVNAAGTAAHTGTVEGGEVSVHTGTQYTPAGGGAGSPVARRPPGS